MQIGFTANDVERIFSMRVGYQPGHSYSFRYGDWNNHMEITVSLESRQILWIESMYIDRVLSEPALRRPSIYEMNWLCFHDGARLNADLETADDPTPFLLNLCGNELDIILEPSQEPALYYLEDRMEFYYGDEYELLYIKVRGLTEEEQTYFRSFVR